MKKNINRIKIFAFWSFSTSSYFLCYILPTEPPVEIEMVTWLVKVYLWLPRYTAPIAAPVDSGQWSELPDPEMRDYKLSWYCGGTFGPVIDFHCHLHNNGATIHRALESTVVLCSAPSVPQLVFTITEKAPTRAFSWLKATTSAFTFKTLLRHYAKRALTPR